MMRLRYLCFFLQFVLRALVSATTVATSAHGNLTFEDVARRYTKRTAGGVHFPIVRVQRSNLRRRGVSAAIGLGNVIDVAYLVLMTIGGITTPLIADTGSSDLWVISDACTQGCSDSVPLYTQSSLQSAGIPFSILYGDSAHGTFATGLIGSDKVDLAGITLMNQSFAAVDRTNTSVTDFGAAGIFGIGFPINSVIWSRLFVQQYGSAAELNRRRELADEDMISLPPNVNILDMLFSSHNGRHIFPSVPDLIGTSSDETPSHHQTRQTGSSSRLAAAFASWSTIGPFIPRLVNRGELTHPMVTITLQRNTIDVGGNLGMLSIGEFPTGVNSSDFLWVPLRGYSAAVGGIPAPPDSPSEVYPVTWEVMIDDVYLDGEKLPISTLSPSILPSALVDTGNSLLRGPADLVAEIRRRLGSRGLFNCSEPHILAFEIGGQRFPVDPRDFVGQAFENSVETCYANLVATDTPRDGGYQFSWSLGTPFLKGVVASYYFGNLTYPSRDQPRLGLLSTVPENAGDLMRAAVLAAKRTDNNFPAVSNPAPSGVPTPARTSSRVGPSSTALSSGDSNSLSTRWTWSVVFITIAFIISGAPNW